MFRSKLFPIVLAASLFALAGNVSAQDNGVSGGSTARNPVSGAEATKPMLRVQLVISRFEGEKKLGSLPYSFVVAPGAPNVALRMGVDAPIPMTSTPAGGNETTTIQYRSIGTNIDCFGVTDLSGGRYQFSIRVENSAAIPGASGDAKGSLPLFRRFETSFTPVLRDGQSMQTIASTDPVTGEVVKVDVTLNVVR